jgi:hypothetical protein
LSVLLPISFGLLFAKQGLTWACLPRTCSD